MAIYEATPKKPEIDLSTSEGNIFHLISIVNNLAKDFNKDGKKIVKDMMAYDYCHALYIFDQEFGEFIDLKLPEKIKFNYINSSKAQYDASQKLKNLTPEKMRQAYLR